MGYLIGGCVNVFVILAAIVIFASLPGVFWGLAAAFLVITILGIINGFSKRQEGSINIPIGTDKASSDDEASN